jgi:hypothetical protein
MTKAGFKSSLSDTARRILEWYCFFIEISLSHPHPHG